MTDLYKAVVLQLHHLTLSSSQEEETMKTLLLASALIAGLFGSSISLPVPFKPFCHSLWLFAVPCAEISSRLVEVIEAFSLSGCADCQNELLSATPLNIKARHSSLGGLQAENITLTLSPTLLPIGCRVSGQSVSLYFTAGLDGGLNYCNLYNLLAASGLTSAPGFMEMTSEWACLGYSLSTCKA